MKSYIKTYLNHFGYSPEQYIKCEIPGCPRRAVDIHHIECRGMGGSKLKDNIENLMAMCREHHEGYGDKKHYIEYLKHIHKKQMNVKIW